MSLFRSTNAQASTVHLGYQLQTSIYGLPIPIIYGQTRIPGNIIWTGNWQAVPYSASGGKGNKGGKAGKGGAAGQMYIYFSAVIIALCQGPIRGIGYLWVNKVRLAVSNASETYTVPSGGGNIQVAAGGGGIPADTGVIVAGGSPLFPVVFSKVTSYSALIPGPQYAFNPATGIYTFFAADAGTSALIRSTGQTYAIPIGGGTFVVGVSSNFQNDNGVSTPKNFNVLTIDFGSPGPSVLAGTQSVRLTRVTGPPGPGEYFVDPATGIYTFNAAESGLSVEIQYTWNDPVAITGSDSIGTQANGNPVTSLGLDLFAGGLGQLPWDYLTASFPSQALGYSNIAYLANSDMNLGFGGVLDNYGFEVLGFLPFGGGTVDACIADVIPHFLTDPFMGAGFPVSSIGDLSELRSYTIASGIFISCAVTSQRTAADWLAEWLKISNCEAVWSGGTLKFRAYGDKTVVGNGVTFIPVTSPIYDLNPDDFISDPGQSPISVTRATVRDAYNAVTVEWVNRGNNYSAEPVEEKDDWAISLYGLRPASPEQLHSITSNRVAQMVANTILQRNVYIRNEYKTKVSALKYMLLEPMDMVTWNQPEVGFFNTPVRIRSLQENDNLELEMEAEEFPWGTATPTRFPKLKIGPFGPEYFQPPGNTLPVVFYEPDLPATITRGDKNTVLIGLTGAQNWGGCHVYVSTDYGKSYSHVGKQTGASTVGYLTAPIPPVTDPDNTSTLSLDMTLSGAPLLSYSKSEADNFVSLAVIDGQELISYQKETLTGTDHYDLNLLRRAIYDSPLSAHNSGASFLFFDDATFAWHFDDSVVNTTVYFKFLSFNKAGLMSQTLNKVTAWPYFVHGERPPYPWATHDPATAIAANDLYRHPNFGLKQRLLTDVNGVITPQFIINGYGIVNLFTEVTVPPTILGASVQPTGGTIAGDQVVTVGVWAQGADNKFTRMSLISVEIPKGTNTNSVVVSVTFANPTDQGWVAISPNRNAGWFGPNAVAQQFNAAASIQAQLLALASADIAYPNLNVDQWLFYWTQVTGIILTPTQVVSLLLIFGIPPAPRATTFPTITSFLAALPSAGTINYQFTTIGQLDTPVPDQEFDRFVAQARVAYVLGLGGRLTGIDYVTGTLSYAGNNFPSSGEWIGRCATCYGVFDPTQPIPIFDEVIVAHTTNSITVDPLSLIDSAADPLISVPLAPVQDAQLTTLAMADVAWPNINTDIWALYWTQVTGVTLTGAQVGFILNTLGILLTARSTTYITQAQFLTALPSGAALLHLGDLVLIHATATAPFNNPALFSPTRIEDFTFVFWANVLPDGTVIHGFEPHTMNGKRLLCIRHQGKIIGEETTVFDNDAIGFNLSPGLSFTPDATTEFVVLNALVDYESTSAHLQFDSIGATVSQAALRDQLVILATPDPAWPNLDIDQWVYYWQIINQITMTPQQVVALILAAGLTIATRSTPVSLDIFMSILPGAGTPVELAINVDNAWRHFFVQTLTENTQGVRSEEQYSPFRLVFQPGFPGLSFFGNPSDTFYIGIAPGGLPGNIPQPGATVGSTLGIEKTTGICYGWDAIANFAGASDIVFDVLKIRGSNAPVSIFGTGPMITIPAGSTLIASGTFFDPAQADIMIDDVLQLVVVSVDPTVPGQRATVNLYWRNAPPLGVAGQ